MRCLKRSVWLLIRRLGLAPLALRLHPRSALRQWGWFRSFRLRRSVDGAGQPLPWWTYSVIAFLRQRLEPEMTVLEFGCGSSTLWLAKHTARVVSVEDCREWAARTRALLPPNAEVVLVHSLAQFAAEGDLGDALFDIIVIDAGDRLRCCRGALRFLSPRGIVLWDNTDGPDWPRIRDLLATDGFREVSFSGLVPQELCTSRTTVFYRDGNCFGL